MCELIVFVSFWYLAILTPSSYLEDTHLYIDVPIYILNHYLYTCTHLLSVLDHRSTQSVFFGWNRSFDPALQRAFLRSKRPIPVQTHQKGPDDSDFGSNSVVFLKPKPQPLACRWMSRTLPSSHASSVQASSVPALPGVRSNESVGATKIHKAYQDLQSKFGGFRSRPQVVNLGTGLGNTGNVGESVQVVE